MTDQQQPRGADARRQASARKAQDQKARRFLAGVLILLVMFVAGSLVLVSKKNGKLASAGVRKTGEINNTVQQSGISNSQSVAAITSNEAGTSAKTGTFAEATTKAPAAAVTVAKEGTIDNPTIIMIDKDKWYLTLVNIGYRIPSTYKPDLTTVCGTSERLDKKVAAAYENMYAAGKKAGVNLTPCSGYRSYALQEKNYKNKISYYVNQGYSQKEAAKKAATIILPPGSSEHNLGYAMDIVCVDEWFEDTAEFKWLQENAADYGFILRYPSDKVKITGVIYEPWHWRYVGVETAKAIKASGLTLDEYLKVS